MSTEDEVRKASEQFYSALNHMTHGDARPLSDIWSHGAAVTTMHPVGGRQVGWDKVRESFQQVAQIASEGRVRLDDQMIQVTGDLAYERVPSAGWPSFPDSRLPWIIALQTSIAARRVAGRSSVTIRMYLRRCWMFLNGCRPKRNQPILPSWV